MPVLSSGSPAAAEMAALVSVQPPPDRHLGMSPGVHSWWSGAPAPNPAWLREEASERAAYTQYGLLPPRTYTQQKPSDSLAESAMESANLLAIAFCNLWGQMHCLLLWLRADIGSGYLLASQILNGMEPQNNLTGFGAKLICRADSFEGPVTSFLRMRSSSSLLQSTRSFAATGRMRSCRLFHMQRRRCNIYKRTKNTICSLFDAHSATIQTHDLLILGNAA